MERVNIYCVNNACESTRKYEVKTHLSIILCTATRAVLLDITVPESAGTVTISVPRLGDLSQRSKGTLTYELLQEPRAAKG